MDLTWRSRTLSFPIELYLSIFDHLIFSLPIQAESRAVLAKLCLVCRAFCQMLQPRIFQALEFSNKRAGKRIRTDGPQGFCAALINGVASATSLAQHVTECTLRDRCASIAIVLGIGPGAIISFWESYRHTLALLPNLRVLNMVGMSLDETMLRVICSLNRLQSLQLQDCFAARGIEPDVIRTLEPLRSLEHFYYKERYSSPDLPYFDILQRIINPTHLKTFHSVSGNVTTNIFKNFTGHSSLIELSLLHAMHNPLLQKILTQSPRLKSLTILSVLPSVPSAPPIPLPASCILDLQSLVCQPSMLSDLVPGRPLQNVIISGVSDDLAGIGVRHRSRLLSLSGHAGMEILARSSTPIRSLCVPLQIFLAGSGAAACHFSSLEQLHLDLHHENYDSRRAAVDCQKDIEEVIRNMCQETPSLPSLRTLTVSFGFRASTSWAFLLNLVLQHYLITSFLEDTFPNVTMITFLTLVQWNKVTNKPNVTKNCDLYRTEEGMGARENKPGTWSAKVPPGNRRMLSVLDEEGYLKEAHDYGGALQAALGSAPIASEYDV